MRNRTADLPLTRQLLYLLSYTGIFPSRPTTRLSALCYYTGTRLSRTKKATHIMRKKEVPAVMDLRRVVVPLGFEPRYNRL